MRGEKGSIRFRSRTQSTKGIIAFVIALISLLSSVGLIVVNAFLKGNGGLLTGVLALFVLVLAAVGFVFALKALYERDVLSVLPITALFINAGVMIFYLCMYFIGF